MTRNAAETLIGALVLVVAIGFFAFAYRQSGVSTVPGYELVAEFSNVGTLPVGADVRISGIKVGAVTDQEIDPETYMARVSLSIDKAIKVPSDTTASVATEGLLGGAYVKLDPGGEDRMLADGGTITYTQGAADLVGLLTQLVFSQKKE